MKCSNGRATALILNKYKTRSRAAHCIMVKQIVPDQASHMSVMPSQHDIHLPSPTQLATLFSPFLSPVDSVLHASLTLQERLQSHQLRAVTLQLRHPPWHQLSIDLRRNTNYLCVFLRGRRIYFSARIPLLNTHLTCAHNSNTRYSGAVSFGGLMAVYK